MTELLLFCISWQPRETEIQEPAGGRASNQNVPFGNENDGVIDFPFRSQTIVGYCRDNSDGSNRTGTDCGAGNDVTCVDEANCNASGAGGAGHATWVTQHSGS